MRFPAIMMLTALALPLLDFWIPYFNDSAGSLFAPGSRDLSVAICLVLAPTVLLVGVLQPMPLPIRAKCRSMRSTGFGLCLSGLVLFSVIWTMMLLAWLARDLA